MYFLAFFVVGLIVFIIYYLEDEPAKGARPSILVTQPAIKKVTPEAPKPKETLKEVLKEELVISETASEKKTTEKAVAKPKAKKTTPKKTATKRKTPAKKKPIAKKPVAGKTPPKMETTKEAKPKADQATAKETAAKKVTNSKSGGRKTLFKKTTAAKVKEITASTS